MWARQSLTRWRAAEGVQSVVVVWTHLAVLLKDRRSELGVHLQTRGKLGACPLGLQPLGPGVYVLLRDRLPTSLPVGHSSLSLSLSHTHTHHATHRERERERGYTHKHIPLRPCTWGDDSYDSLLRTQNFKPLLRVCFQGFLQFGSSTRQCSVVLCLQSRAGAVELQQVLLPLVHRLSVGGIGCV